MIADVTDLVRRQVAEETRRAKGDRTKPAAPRGKPGPKPKSKGRAQAVALQAKVLAVLGSAKKKGVTLGDIANRTGAGRVTLQYHLRALRLQKRAKMVGNRATARWLAA